MSNDHSDDNNNDNPNQPGRRKAVRRMLVGGGIITAGSQATTNWVKPSVDTILLSAHAETTQGTNAPSINPTFSSAPTLFLSTAPTVFPSSAPTFSFAPSVGTFPPT